MTGLAELIENMINDRMKAVPIIKATVKTPPPNLTIEFDGQVIPSEQIYCSNYLLPHYHRDYKIDGVVDEIKIDVSNYAYDNTTSDTAGHGIPKLNGSGTFQGNGTYKSHKDIWFEDTLQKGDEVLVLVMGVHYVVVTRIVKMPSGAIEGV